MVVPSPDDIVSRITEDHRTIERHFANFDRFVPGAYAELLWKLTHEVVRHEVAEEVVLYPVIRELLGADEVVDARIAEQVKAQEALARLGSLDPEGSEFADELAALRATTDEHVRHEEREVLPLLAHGLSTSQLISLGRRFEGVKAAAPTHPHPRLPHTPPGNVVTGPVAALVDRIRDAIEVVA